MQLVVAALISGHVIAAESRWTDDGLRIVTDAVVETDDGRRVTVSELGGAVDGVGQITLPGPALLAPGMIVSVDAHDAASLSGVHALVVDDVAVDLVAGTGAWVREGPTPAGNSLFWASGCIFMTYDDAGTAELAGDEEFPILDAALANWNSSIATCGYQKLMSAGRAAGHEVGKDYINLIKFRDTKWCIPATATDAERCHPAAAAGITTLTFVKHPGNSDDGQILDADVELNGADFAISNAGHSLGTQTCFADLANTVTHELGHVLGLEHTCVTSSDPARVDNNGAAVPACPSTDPRITEATMYPFQTCGETKKASLSDDDIQGACSIYPKAQDPGTCSPATAPGGCCDAGDAPASGSLALAAFVLAGLRRRRARRGVWGNCSGSPN